MTTNDETPEGRARRRAHGAERDRSSAATTTTDAGWFDARTEAHRMLIAGDACRGSGDAGHSLTCNIITAALRRAFDAGLARGKDGERRPMKRGGPIVRRTPLRATGRLRPRQAKVARVSKRASKRTPEASSYMTFVRTLSCIVCACKPVDASHVSLGPNEKGIGMKVPDFQVVPHCRGCHQEWEERRGRFAGWDREKRWFEARCWVLRTHMAAAMNEIPTKDKEP